MSFNAMRTEDGLVTRQNVNVSKQYIRESRAFFKKLSVGGQITKRDNGGFGLFMICLRYVSNKTKDAGGLGGFKAPAGLGGDAPGSS